MAVQKSTRGDSKKIRHEFHQTDSEVIVTLFPGGSAKSLNVENVKVEQNETNCTVMLPGDRFWSTNLFDVILPEFTTVQQKSNKIIVKMMKKTPGNWDSLELKEIEESSPQDEVVEEILEIEPEKPVLELQYLKHDFYEKSPESLTLSIYVKNISKETLIISFEEKQFILKFQTGDKNFLAINKSTNDTTFAWTVQLKAFIQPDLCRFKLTNTKLDLFFTKSVPSKWNGLEGISPKSGVTEVPSSTWIAAKESSHTEAVKISEPNCEEKLDNQEKMAPQFDTKKEMQKPTCMVSPLNKNEISHQVKPGFSGLKNLGNTCFMNSVLQCLVNTRELRDYFRGDYFQSDINMDNPLGMNGQLAVAFAVLIRMLWLGNQQCYIPSKLKVLIGIKATQFSGFAQHDAQEFMAFFLDGLHEDLNRVKDKPYIENTNTDNKPDEVAADESWQNYKKRNDSIVVSLFQGQYKSKLVCPVCQKVSITFDPFLYLSLPLPKELSVFSIYFFHKDPIRKPIKYFFRVPIESTVGELRKKVALKSSVNEENLRFFAVFRQVHLKSIPVTTVLSKIESAAKILVFEVYDEKLVGEPVVELKVTQRLMLPPIKNCCSNCGENNLPHPDRKFKRCSKCWNVAYCNVNCQRSDWPKHQEDCIPTPIAVGLPFLISLPKSQTTFATLCRILGGISSHFVDIFQPPVENCAPSVIPSSPSNISNVETESVSSLPILSSPIVEETGMEKSISELNLSDIKPDFTKEKQTVRIVIGQQDKLNRSKPHFYVREVDSNGQTLKSEQLERPPLEDKGNESVLMQNVTHLAMDWNNNNKHQNYVLVQSKELDCEIDNSSCANVNEDPTLDECLQLFTEPEVLASKDAWYCPSCKEHREATKQLSLWRLPPVLIVQLKRFSYGGLLHYREKLDKMIEFPIRGLDLTPYVCKPGNEDVLPPLYDLYAVVNHQGGILGGHYTSFARCVDLKDTRRSEVDWRLFDDGYVNSTSESSVVSEAAYVLFYRRRAYQFSPYRRMSDESVIIESKNKAQKQRENVLDLEMASGGESTTNLDSNITNYVHSTRKTEL